MAEPPRMAVPMHAPFHKRRVWIALVSTCLMAMAISPSAVLARGKERGHRQRDTPRLGRTLFAPVFASGTELVANDYADFNPQNPAAVQSKQWLVTSGSLFAHNRAGWTGVPDSVVPNATSSNGTGSATFRAVTRRRNFGSVAVVFNLLNQRTVTTPRTPARNWDGVHVLLHYQSPYSFYVVSVNRRDGLVLVKKKVPGGPSNGGTYYTIGTPAHFRPRPGRWQHVVVTIKASPRRSVTITATINRRRLLDVTDRGGSGPVLARAGAIGLRGDNTEFEFAHFQVRAIR
jgi:hypothetical protein